MCPTREHGASTISPWHCHTCHATAPLLGSHDDSEEVHLEGELVLLPAPDVETLVIAAQLPEPLAADGEVAAGHDRAPERLRRLLLVLGRLDQGSVDARGNRGEDGGEGDDGEALVVELPVEGAPGPVVLDPVLERVAAKVY